MQIVLTKINVRMAQTAFMISSRLLYIFALIPIFCGSSIAHHDPRCNPALNVQICVDYELDQSNRLNLVCVDSRGERPLTTDVQWLKNGVIHTDSTRIHREGARLIFEEVLVSDEGNWTCSNGSLSPPFTLYGEKVGVTQKLSSLNRSIGENFFIPCNIELGVNTAQTNYILNIYRNIIYDDRNISSPLLQYRHNINPKIKSLTRDATLYTFYSNNLTLYVENFSVPSPQDVRGVTFMFEFSVIIQGRTISVQTTSAVILQCLRPLPPINGILEPLIRNRVNPNFIVTFKCKRGFEPSDLFSTICLNNSTWSPSPMNHVCTDVDECEFNICPESSQCINTVGSYTCACNVGYFHDEHENMCIDVDECNFGIHTCGESSHADCINTEGSYICVYNNSCDSTCEQHCASSVDNKCACDRGYYLASDHVSCKDINECLVPNFDGCDHAQCNNTVGSYMCICEPGFISDGENNCIDINECATDTDNCDTNADCTNTVGSFICICHSLYYGDGVLCSKGISPEIDQRNRVKNPNHKLLYTAGTNFCLENPRANFNSTIVCRLAQRPDPPPEFQWKITLNESDLTFDDIAVQIASTNYDNDTVILSQMVITGLDQYSVLQVTCDVSNSFGNDTGITSVRVCGPSQCQDGVTNNCTQNCIRNAATGAHMCSCQSGFEFQMGSDSVCEDINECAKETHNCSLDSRLECNNTPGSYLCECISGFRGDNCEDIDECELGKYKCPILSSCINIYGSYNCICINDTKMDSKGNCAEVNECLEGNHNCSENARCEKVPGGYNCICHTGFEGNGEMCTISNDVIISTSVFAGIVVAMALLILIALGSAKLRKQRKISVQKNVRHNKIEDSIALDANEGVVMRGSLKAKLPPALTITSTNLRVLDPIGQGEFGIVYKGYLIGQHTDQIVAIKTLKGFIDSHAIQDLLNECAKMKDFDYLHVMTLKGVCLDGGPVPYIVLPFMANGSLLTYLRKQRPNLVLKEDTDSENKVQSQVILFTRKRLMDMCLQVAKGMEYLASKKVVHRDLAARNCMIDLNMVIKVADFGLAVNIGAKEYYRLTKHADVKLPLMWMAPESLSDYMFSEMSDIWSYGVTCWEIFTGGQAPYTGVKPSSLLTILQQGQRLEIPNNAACNQEMYSVMLQCWEMEPGKRPSFSVLVKTLSSSLEEMADYLHVGAFTDLDCSTGEAEHKL